MGQRRRGDDEGLARYLGRTRQRRRWRRSLRQPLVEASEARHEAASHLRWATTAHLIA